MESASLGSPVAAALSLFEGVDEVAARLGDIRCPVLLLSSRQDHVVPSSSGDLLVAQAGTAVERVWLERSYHVATLDHDAPEIETRVVSFMASLFGEPAPDADGATAPLTASTAGPGSGE